MDITFENILYQLLESMRQQILANASEGEKEEITQGYEQYLVLSYQPIISEQRKSGRNARQLFGFLLATEKRRWRNNKIEDVKSTLLPDENYLELQKIAEAVFEKAKERAAGKTLGDENQYPVLLSRLNNRTDKVQDFNKNYASEILSNALLDLAYAFGKSDVMSLRLSNYVRKSENQN